MLKRLRLPLVISAAVVLPLVGLGVYLLTPPKPGVTLENFRRLHAGMTVEEVEAILGSRGKLGLGESDRWNYEWVGKNEERCQVSACRFRDQNQTVTLVGPGVYFLAKEPFLPIERMAEAPEGVLDRVRRWLKDRIGL